MQHARRPAAHGPVAVAVIPATAPYLVETLADAHFVVPDLDTKAAPNVHRQARAYAWPCGNPACPDTERTIRPGHVAVRTTDGDYLHAGCHRSGWPTRLIRNPEHTTGVTPDVIDRILDRPAGDGAGRTRTAS